MNHEKSPKVNSPETEQKATVVELVAPNGLGFGEGGIRVRQQIEEGILTEEAPRRIHEVLIDDPNTFKAVEADDDGCGDGRPWSKIIRLIGQGGKKQIKLFKTSLLRAKVFGGGLVVASSMWRNIKGTPGDDETVGSDRAFMADELRERGFSHGAHSDDHAEGENCGCGAIDKYPEITINAIKYRQKITEVLKVLYGDNYAENADAIESTFGVYSDLAEQKGYFKDASGKQSMEQILDSGSVVKELSGRHVEDTIVLNEVEGTTLDQLYFTQTVKNACVGERKPKTVQAFSVDIWRGKKIANEVAEIARQKHEVAIEHDLRLAPDFDIEKVYRLAYADFLVRTLAVAATLTAGDLPVYLRRAA